MFRLFAFVRRPVVFLSGVLIFLLLILGTGLYVSSYVEGAAFHDYLERATSHGLHLEAHYGQLHHIGVLGLQTPSFNGVNGFRSIQSLTLQNITAYYSPMGVLQGRWDVDDIVAEQGEVRLQKVTPVPDGTPLAPPSPPTPAPASTVAAPNTVTADPATTPAPPVPLTTNTALPVETAPVVTPVAAAPVVTTPVPVAPAVAPAVAEPAAAAPSSSVPPESVPTPPPTDTPPPVPWYKAWLPQRVSLRHVLVKDANIIMTVRGQDGGFYDTQMVITPNDRDYEYDAHDGEMRMPGIPVMHINHGHVLVRKAFISFPELLFDEGPDTPDHMLRVEGTAGLKDDKTIKATFDWNKLDIAKWLPTHTMNLTGLMGGHVEYQSPDLVIEHATGQGNLHLDGVTIPEISALEKYSQMTGAPNPGPMPLKQAQTDMNLKDGVLTLSNIAIESEGIFRVEGTLTVTLTHELQGDIQLGLTDPYIRWLPTAKKHIFTENRNGYWFAMVHVSGTMENPQQDLTQRVFDEVKRDPFLALKLLMRKLTH